MSKPKNHFALNLANALGGVSYLSVILQWAWSSLVLFYPILVANPEMFAPGPDREVARPPLAIDWSMPAMQPVAILIAAATLVLVLLTLVFVVAKLPARTSRKVSHVTHQASAKLLPLVVEPRKITPKERQKLSYRLVVLLKFASIALPLPLLRLVSSSVPMPASAIWGVALFLAAMSIVFLLLQIWLVWAQKLDTNKII